MANIYEMDYPNAELALRAMSHEELVQQAMSMRAGMKLTERTLQGLAAQVFDLIYSATHISDEAAKERYLNAAMAALKPLAEGEKDA